MQHDQDLSVRIAGPPILPTQSIEPSQFRNARIDDFCSWRLRTRRDDNCPVVVRKAIRHYSQEQTSGSKARKTNTPSTPSKSSFRACLLSIAVCKAEYGDGYVRAVTTSMDLASNTCLHKLNWSTGLFRGSLTASSLVEVIGVQ